MAEEREQAGSVVVVQEGATLEAKDMGDQKGRDPRPEDEWNLISGGPSLLRLELAHLLPFRPVVTVNRAISVIDRGIKVNFAAFADAPSGCWIPLNLERYLHMDPSIQIWASLRPVTQQVTVYRKAEWKRGMEPPHFMKDFLKGIMKVLPDDTHKAFTKFVEKYFFDKEQRIVAGVPGPAIAYFWDKELPAGTGIRFIPHGDLQDPTEKSVMREAFTTYAAFDRICSFRPKKVRILCCDMAGSYIEGKTYEECQEHERTKTSGPKDRWAHERHHMHDLARVAKEKFGTETEWVIP
jgi:hypothetical protein